MTRAKSANKSSTVVSGAVLPKTGLIEKANEHGKFSCRLSDGRSKGH